MDNDNESMIKFLQAGLVTLSSFLLIFICAHFLSEASSVFIANNAKKLPIYCVETDEPKVSLSFDAAWGNEDTNEILSILDKYNVKVTFFMTGGWVEKYPEDVKNIAKAGHDLGNHSENHKEMSKLSESDCKNEVISVNKKLKKLTDKEVTLFRPPYGDYNNTVVETVNALGCHCVQWDVDSLDWKNYGVDSMISTVLNHKALGNGSIILMHNGAKYTKDALPSIIEGLQEKGFELVPISELIYKENYEMDIQGRQHPISTTKHSATPNS